MSGGLKKIILVFPLLLCFLGMPFTAAGQAPEREIVIELSNFRLYLYQDGVKLKEYPIAIGAPASPTPVGEAKIVNRVYFPTYYPRNWGEKGLSPIAPGPDNPVGTRWLGLSLPNYGIHGTNNNSSIGKAVSDGCIRMFNQDVEELFELVRIGTPVKIVQKKVEPIRPQEQDDKFDQKGNQEAIQEINQETGKEEIQEIIQEVKPGLFLIQVGAFENRNNALRTQDKLKAAGYSSDVYSNNLFMVQLEGQFAWLEAKLLQFDLERLGFSVFIKYYGE